MTHQAFNSLHTEPKTVPPAEHWLTWLPGLREEPLRDAVVMSSTSTSRVNHFATSLLAVKLLLWWQEGWTPSAFRDIIGPRRLQQEVGEDLPFYSSLPRNPTLHHQTLEIQFYILLKCRCVVPVPKFNNRDKKGEFTTGHKPKTRRLSSSQRRINPKRTV